MANRFARLETPAVARRPATNEPDTGMVVSSACPDNPPTGDRGAMRTIPVR